MNTTWDHIWFPPLFTLFQAFAGGILVPLLIPFAFLIWKFWPEYSKDRARLWWMVFLPMSWIALSIWTSFNWYRDNMEFNENRVAGCLAGLSIALTIILSIAIIVQAKRARVVVMCFSLPNLWVTAVGALLCLMATSGEWL